MSPRRVAPDLKPAVETEIRRTSVEFGAKLRDLRAARRWSVAELSRRAGLSAAMVYRVEAGRAASSETHARLAVALGRRLEVDLVDPRRRAIEGRDLAADVVHSAMGEVEAGRLRTTGVQVGIDEPYQHYHFAGRADVVAWDLEGRHLLHIENRTRFPDFQEMAGAYNAKRAYLGLAMAARAGIDRWRTETHVLCALWSSEVLHALRLRTESFRALCPDEAAAFDEWWSGRRNVARSTSLLVVLDPIARGRQRQYVGLDEALAVRPRHRGYAAAAATLRTAR